MRIRPGRVGLHLAILCLFAIAQPLMSLMAATPEFFAARASSSQEILTWLFVLLLVMPTALLLVWRLMLAANGKLADYLYLGMFCLLVLLILLPVFNRLAILPAALAIGLCAAAALAVTWLYWRSDLLRGGFSYLAIGFVVFPLSFLFGSDIRALVLPETRIAASASHEMDAGLPSVLFLLFDELPLYSLLDSEGRINAQRYPNFARLAASATWYPNTTTVADHTHDAIPALLSGRYPGQVLNMPVYAFHKDNLFTRLAPSHHLTVREGMGKLCPRFLCERPDETFAVRMFGLLSDTAIVYTHIIAPAPLARYLPDVSQNWQNFGAQGSDYYQASNPKLMAAMLRALGKLRDIPQMYQEFAQLLASPTAEPRLDYLHIVFPHVPFRYLPSGRAYPGKVIEGFDKGEWQNEWAAQLGYQRYQFQLVYADDQLGRLLDVLEQNQRYDKTLIVLSSDHGASYRAGGQRRHLDAHNAAEILPVPLFIKLPGQRAGRLDQRQAETIDVLPTVLDALGLEISGQLDGRSLLTAHSPAASPVLAMPSSERKLQAYTQGQLQLDEAQRQRLARFGESVADLYRFGPFPHLLGQLVEGYISEQASELSLQASEQALRLRVEEGSRQLPAKVSLRLDGLKAADSYRDLPVAIAVNGRIQATAKLIIENGGLLLAAMLPEEVLQTGELQLSLYQIHSDNGEVLLQPIH